MSKKTKKWGDRRDGTRVNDGDPLHLFMPYLLGSRCDNEALLNETFDMSAVDQYLKAKNDANPQFRYTYFHVILAAFAKTIYLKPKLNRFIAGHRLYDRNRIDFSFVAKNEMSENGAESLLIVSVENNGEGVCQQLHDKITKETYKVKEEKVTDGTTENLKWLSVIPRPLLRLVVRLLFWLHYHDLLPNFLAEVDPYRTSVFVSNLGSIKMQASYHHLVNWSTNSIFLIINRAKMTPFFEDDGSYTMRNAISMGFTLDERIADGFYFARSVDLFKQILNHPECLDEPLDAPVHFED